MMPVNGTVHDIIQWMRGLTESWGTKRRVNVPTITVQSWLHLCHALEEASRRDTKAARDAIYREAEKNASKALAGNSAAIRAAMVEVLATLKSWYAPDNRTAARLIALQKKCEAALAVPARNCDRFNSEDDSYQAWQKERGWPADVDNRGGYGMAWAFSKWLFWTLAETSKNLEVIRDRVKKTGTAWPGSGSDKAYVSPATQQEGCTP